MQLTGNVQGLIDLVGGGSDVSVEAILESGEKIAVITVDNVPTDIYAPEGGGSDVVVTQVLSSGTKIASIEVDGEDVDLYAPTPEEPTSVEVTQVLSSGTKIASIDVDGESTDIYAPTENYTTNEKVIGTWIDGKPLYEKTIEWSGTSYNNSIKIDNTLDSTNIKMCEFVGVGYMHDNINELVIPYCNLTASQYLSINVADGVWLYNGGVNRIIKVFATIRYTKNSDT